MKILVDGHTIVASGEVITFGKSDENFDKWSVFGKNGEFKFYCLDGNYQLIDVEEPDGFREEMYIYTDGKLVKNEEYVPYESPEDRIIRIETENTKLTGVITILEEQLAAQDEAIIELYELLQGDEGI